MKRLAFLFIAALLISAPAFAAGSMSNVGQDVDVSGANITSNPASMGVSSGFGIKGVSIDAEKTPGDISIGKISNKGQKMENVRQKVKASGSTISSNGAGISIGDISNSNK